MQSDRLGLVGFLKFLMISTELSVIFLQFLVALDLSDSIGILCCTILLPPSLSFVSSNTL